VEILQTIIILGDPVIKKNTKKISKNGGVYYTKIWKEYELKAKLQLSKFPTYDLPYPVELHFKFFPRTNRRFDLSNMVEGAQDLLQATGHIVDDDWKHITPVFNGEYGGVIVEPGIPRTEITIIK